MPYRPCRRILISGGRRRFRKSRKRTSSIAASPSLLLPFSGEIVFYIYQSKKMSTDRLLLFFIYAKGKETYDHPIFIKVGRFHAGVGSGHAGAGV
jgi:hypothetical protein